MNEVLVATAGTFEPVTMFNFGPAMDVAIDKLLA